MADTWEFYPTDIDDDRASIYVDLSLRSKAPFPNLEELTWLRVCFLKPRDDGLSSSEEFDRLSELEDAIFEALENCECTNLYVGRTTSAGKRDFYVYSSNGILIETVLQQALVPFREYSFDTGQAQDEEWTCYLEFLCPTPRESQLITNRHVLDWLKESNDHFEIPRPVSHWVYFPTCAARESFVNMAVCEGFEVDHEVERDSDDGKFGVLVVRTDPVSYRAMNELVVALFDFAVEAGGKYDGWETPIVSGDDVQMR